MSFRQFVLVTHRWIGLVSSPILAIVGATGVMLMFDLEGLRIGRYASALHERLAFGMLGHRIVLLATLAGVLLEVGGLVLWWKRKTLAIALGSGWWRACFDLHHLAGVVCLPLMLLGAATGLLMFIYPPSESAELYRIFRQLHVGRFPLPLRVVYMLATLGFVAQGVTGFVVWWKRKT
jgi:uncharacterized iron-regulated membrane protein